MSSNFGSESKHGSFLFRFYSTVLFGSLTCLGTPSVAALSTTRNPNDPILRRLESHQPVIRSPKPSQNNRQSLSERLKELGLDALEIERLMEDIETNLADVPDE